MKWKEQMKKVISRLSYVHLLALIVNCNTVSQSGVTLCQIFFYECFRLYALLSLLFALKDKTMDYLLHGVRVNSITSRMR